MSPVHRLQSVLPVRLGRWALRRVRAMWWDRVLSQPGCQALWALPLSRVGQVRPDPRETPAVLQRQQRLLTRGPRAHRDSAAMRALQGWSVLDLWAYRG